MRLFFCVKAPPAGKKYTFLMVLMTTENVHATVLYLSIKPCPTLKPIPSNTDTHVTLSFKKKKDSIKVKKK